MRRKRAKRKPNRQAAPKPWEAIGMSRATWYRHGKPDKKRERVTVTKLAEMTGASSTRTFQRLMRVLQDPDLATFVAAGLKPGQAEKLLFDPERKRRFLAAVKAAAERKR